MFNIWNMGTSRVHFILSSPLAIFSHRAFNASLMLSNLVAVEKSYRTYPPSSSILTNSSHPADTIFSAVLTPHLSNHLYVLEAILSLILAPNRIDARNHLNLPGDSAKSIPRSFEYNGNRERRRSILFILSTSYQQDINKCEPK